MERTKTLATNGLSVAGDVTGTAALGGLSSALEQLSQECDKIRAHKVPLPIRTRRGGQC
jgi:hypothetical protein